MLAAVIVALLTGSTAPLWWDQIFANSDTATGSTIHWFQIEAVGRAGRVQDNPTQVANRSVTCA